MTSTDPAPLDFGNPSSALHKYAVAAAAMEDDRIDHSTRKGYESALRHFDNFCVKHKIFNVLTTRFPEQPALISLYLAKLVMSNLSEWSAEKARSAIVWKTEIAVGGHPTDKWEEITNERGELTARGNPGTATQVRRALRGLRKKERRLHRPKHATPVRLNDLEKLLTFTRDHPTMAPSLKYWWTAASSLAFYGMLRVGELLQLKYRDVGFGLTRDSLTDGSPVTFGWSSLRDRKTDDDPQASRRYYLHYLPKSEWACEAITHVQAWIKFATDELGHVWQLDDFLFPRVVFERRRRSKTPGQPNTNRGHST